MATMTERRRILLDREPTLGVAKFRCVLVESRPWQPQNAGGDRCIAQTKRSELRLACLEQNRLRMHPTSKAARELAFRYPPVKIRTFNKTDKARNVTSFK
jgi:hypothetical protein